MVIIPIGIDCGVAGFLRERGIRMSALPFDWCVSYNGVSDIFKEDFARFSDATVSYGMKFPHGFDIDTYTRRIDRLRTILKSDDRVIFIRKGHAKHNHFEYADIKNDITDSEQLYHVLKERYPHLQFEIIVTLACADCFDPTTTYTSDYVRIVNIATPLVDNDRFMRVLTDIRLNG